jgi:hypothetical protein
MNIWGFGLPLHEPLMTLADRHLYEDSGGFGSWCHKSMLRPVSDV